MVRKLVDLNLARHEPYGSVERTPAGGELALAMVRRHRLLETFLVRKIGYGWDEVHDEAEVLEHTVSDTFIDRLDAKLGRPARDPHGNPIPAVDGSIEMPAAHAMRVLDDGHRGRISRISDTNPALLRFLTGESVGLDCPVRVVGRKPFGGALEVRVGTGRQARNYDFGEELAGALWVETDEPHPGCTLQPRPGSS